jgi:hypothetical protein
MAESKHLCWVNCCDLEDNEFLSDQERIAIDRMQASLEPLNANITAIRQLITRFESCYHEADKEAKLIIKAIGSEQCPTESDTRPPQRQKELENAKDILSAWLDQTLDKVTNLKIGDISANELIFFLGKQTPLKTWQTQRIVDKIGQVLNPNEPYYNLALSGEAPPESYYKDNLDYLRKTREIIIHDTVEGQKAEMSLAIAIDLIMPCHWDFVGYLCAILKAINGQLAPAKPLTCCARNLYLSPLFDKLKTISDTLGAYCHNREIQGNIDRNIYTLLGEKTAVKCWLTASLDKTIRYQLNGTCPTSLI